MSVVKSDVGSGCELLEVAPVEVIAAKRDGREHSPALVRAWIEDYVAGRVTDAQMSAWTMAVIWQGMTFQETAALCSAMAESGRVLDWPGIERPIIDKHSTGGVGDKLSLVIAPLASAAGLAVPMLSGRGLGHTGGTLDKLEAIAGLGVDFSVDELDRILRESGCFIAAASSELAPADARLYQLRDQTGTVASIPLIVASILAKKVAGGASGLVMDVKYGRAAFMPDLESGTELSEQLVAIGTQCGLRVASVVNRMDVPIGHTIGNALEVQEALDVLRGGGPGDVRALSLELVSVMLELGGLDVTPTQLEALLDGGYALEVFERMVRAQGGDLAVALPEAPLVREVTAGVTGVVTDIDALSLGKASWRLGAGREKPGGPIDHSAGVRVLVSVGDRVSDGDLVLELHASSESAIERSAGFVAGAVQVDDQGGAV